MRPSLRTRRASRRVGRQGAPGRDNSRPVASSDTVVSSRCTRMSPAIFENAWSEPAGRRSSRSGCTRRLVTVGPLPRTETRTVPWPVDGTRKLSGSRAAHCSRSRSRASTRARQATAAESARSPLASPSRSMKAPRCSGSSTRPTSVISLPSRTTSRSAPVSSKRPCFARGRARRARRRSRQSGRAGSGRASSGSCGASAVAAPTARRGGCGRPARSRS